MDWSSYSPEVQLYIREVEEKRKRTGILDYDTCQNLLEYAAEVNSDGLFGMGYYYFAEIYWQQKQYERTMHCLTECTKYFRSAEMYEFLAKTYNLMGAVSDGQNNRVVALNYFYISLQYAEKYHFTYVLAMVYSNIGYVLIRMHHYADALEKYKLALEYFEQSEKNVHCNYNIMMCMISCGICYLHLQQTDRALETLDKMQQLSREYPESSYPQLNMIAFQAKCAAAEGKEELFFQYLDIIIEKLKQGSTLEEVEDTIADVVAQIAVYQRTQKMDELFAVLVEKGFEKNISLFMDLYPHRSQCLMRRKRTAEHLEYTKKYFQAYEEYREKNRELTIRVIELLEQLHTVEQEKNEIYASNQKLESIAKFDSMTNLANRDSYNEFYTHKFEEALAQRKLLGVEMLDIDYFKKYNDTNGHLKGDGCIEAVAGVLREIANSHVFCARYGGDEFVIIYSDMTKEEIMETAETIRRRVEELQIPHSSSECAKVVTVTQGIFARIPNELNREWDFSSMADITLYHAKNEGRNRWLLRTEFAEKAE